MEHAIKKIDEYLSKVEGLLKKSYKEGKDEESELDTKIQGFIRAIFKDDDKKLRDYTHPLRIGIIGREKSEQEKQEDYLSDLRKMKNHLLAFKEEINLIIASKQKSGKLDKIEEETKIIAAEAKRRRAVVDEKLLGAIMEFIQMQRDELKKKGLLTQEIVDIRKDIADIKSTLNDLKNVLEKTGKSKD